eukprot:CAMPEP_0170549010 /NCGR_PEP_ID=MMETSP0211-20121228/7181_1 /TAXON_ID=311385 /ORGANISM="Pseudokeronopsis sp., Strain OXSARD2" /LENGTH=41 /DNA_ID= /DNA_START= /DNA_END= /DNA_ORIENTATION=
MLKKQKHLKNYIEEKITDLTEAKINLVSEQWYGKRNSITKN